MKNYVALYRSSAVRDAQVCQMDQAALEKKSETPWDDEYWRDAEDAEVFIGIFSAETEQDAIAQAVRQEGCDGAAVRVIEAGYSVPVVQ